MTKEDVKDLKRSVRRNLLNKNLLFSCLVMLLKYVSQLLFLYFFILLISSLTNLTIVENFIPNPFLQIKNLYKPIFIIFLLLIVLLMYFLILFLNLGIKRWCYLLSKDSTTSFLEIFYYYNGKSAMLRAIKLKFFIMLRLTFNALGLLLPPVILFILLSVKMQLCSQEVKVLLALFMIVSMMVFFINTMYFIKQIIIYNLYKTIFFSNEVKNLSKGLKKIKLIFKKNKFDFFKFLVSLSYFYLSCIFILPPLVVMPYLYMMLYSYTDSMIKNNQGKISEPKYKLFYVDINTELNF